MKLAEALDDRNRQAFLNIQATEWHDERGSWELGADGRYVKIPGERSAQAEFAEARM